MSCPDQRSRGQDTITRFRRRGRRRGGKLFDLAAAAGLKKNSFFRDFFHAARFTWEKQVFQGRKKDVSNKNLECSCGTAGTVARKISKRNTLLPRVVEREV